MQFNRKSVAFLLLCLFPSLANAKIDVGDKPTLHFKAFDSHNTIDLTALKGKIVVVDFWATWCGPCMGEAAHMVATNEKYASKGLQFIGVSLDDDPSALKKIIAEKNFTWPMLYEGQAWNGPTPKSWGVNSIPQTFIISPEGEVLWRGHPAEIDSVLEKAFKEHPPQLVDPKVLEQGNKTLDQAQAALDGNKPAAALSLLVSFPQAARVDPATADRLTQISSKLTDYGNSELKSTDSMVAEGKYSQARQKLIELLSVFNGTPVAVSAKTRLTELAANPKASAQLQADKVTREATDALAVANQLKADKKDELAYPRFKTIIKQYPGSPAATQAMSAVKEYESDKTFMAKYMSKAGKSKAESILAMAASYRSAGNNDQAIAKYQEVITQFPDTSWAETARKGITDLGNQ